MGKRTHIEYVTVDKITVAVTAFPDKCMERLDYRAHTSLSTGDGGFRSLSKGPAADIWRDPQQPRTHEWIVTWPQAGRRPARSDYYPTLGAALTAIGRRAVKEV